MDLRHLLRACGPVENRSRPAAHAQARLRLASGQSAPSARGERGRARGEPGPVLDDSILGRGARPRSSPVSREEMKTTSRVSTSSPSRSPRAARNEAPACARFFHTSPKPRPSRPRKTPVGRRWPRCCARARAPTGRSSATAWRSSGVARGPRELESSPSRPEDHLPGRSARAAHQGARGAVSAPAPPAAKRVDASIRRGRAAVENVCGSGAAGRFDRGGEEVMGRRDREASVENGCGDEQQGPVHDDAPGERRGRGRRSGGGPRDGQAG